MGYQPVNYANDFLVGMRGAQEIVSQRKQDDRRDKEMEQRTERHGLDVKKSQLEIDQIERQVAEDVKFEAASKLTTFNGLLDTAKPEELKAAKDDAAIIGQGVDWLKSQAKVWADPAQAQGNPVGGATPTVMGGNRYWLKDVANDPETRGVTEALAKYTPNLLGREFKDPASGRTYRTSHISKIAVGEDGKMLAILGANYTDNGEPYRDVPRTVKGSNSPDDPLNFVDIDLTQQKLAFYHNVYDQALSSGRSSSDVAREMAGQLLYDNLPVAVKKQLVQSRLQGEQRTEQGLQQKRGEFAITDERAEKTNAKTEAEMAELEPKLEAILADDTRSAQQKRGAIASLVSSYSPETQARLTGSRSMATAMVPGRDEVKQVTKYEEGVKGRPGYVREVIELSDGRTVRGEPYQKHAPKGDGNGGGNGKLSTDARLLKEDIAKSSAMYAARRKAFNKEANERWASASDEDKPALEKELLAAQAELDAEKAALEIKAESFFEITGKKYLPGGVERSGGMTGAAGGNGGGGQPVGQSGGAKPLTARNPKTGQRIVSYDNGKSWQPAQ